jgi:GNAT superfamily N-acetyltransferase
MDGVAPPRHLHDASVVAAFSGRWEIRRLVPEEVERVGTVLGLARLDQGNGFYLRWEHRRHGVASELTAAAERESRERGFDRLRLSVGVENAPAQALYRRCGYVDSGVPPKRVQGTILLRTGPLEVDDTLLTWEKRLLDEE